MSYQGTDISFQERKSDKSVKWDKDTQLVLKCSKTEDILTLTLVILVELFQELFQRNAAQY